MKVAIIGSRSLDLNIKNHIPKNTTLIITGGAKGIDKLAEKYAVANNIPIKIVKPEYEKYGKFAPLLRNKKIVESSDVLIIFWDGKSKGTQHVIQYAYSLGKQVSLHKISRIQK